MSRPAAWVIALLLGWAAPDFAHGQVFLASRPNPEVTIRPLFVLAPVAPESGVLALDVLMSLKMELTDLMKRRKATWIEDLFWGPQHTISLTFNDTRPRALFPLYFERRDRVVRLADDPSQLLVNFRDADHLKIYEFYPGSARRRLSETLDSTEEITLFLDSSEGITPQVLTVQFGYFRVMRS